MKKKTKIISTVATIAVAAISAYLIWGRNEAPFEVTYETAKVEKATIGSSITATGTIEPVTEVEVGTQVSGMISKIYVDYNSVVKKGQIIAELDRTNLISELNSAKAQLASAQSELDYQATNYKRIKTLYDKGLVSANEYDTAYLSWKKAQQTVANQQEAVAKAQTNLGYATITSPIDGTVLTKDVEEGQTVASSYSTPTLFTIAQDLKDMRVIADVDEADIGGVKEGQRVTFTVDAYPEDTFQGAVTQVRQEGTTEDNVVTYEVVISAPNDELELKPGLTANVTIYTLERNGVLSVPTKALRFMPTKETIGPKDKIEDCRGTHKLWTREGRTFKAYAVQTGISNGTRTEIVTGIPEGTRVIVDMKDASTTADEETAPSNGENAERSPFAPGPPQKDKKKK